MEVLKLTVRPMFTGRDSFTLLCRNPCGLSSTVLGAWVLLQIQNHLNPVWAWFLFSKELSAVNRKERLTALSVVIEGSTMGLGAQRRGLLS
jgi:hypothetical protein